MHLKDLKPGTYRLCRDIIGLIRVEQETSARWSAIIYIIA